MASKYSPPSPQLDSYLEPNYEPHYTAWKKDPSPENMTNLVKTVDPIINEAMRAYGGGSSQSPTLRSKARGLTVSAIQSYNPSKAKLRTHLLSQLQGLRRMAAKEEQIIHIPEQVQLDFGRIRNAENQLRDRLGREPSDVELADEVGLSRKRISYVRGVKPTYAEGRLTVLDEEGGGMSTPSVETMPTSPIMRSWQDFVYHDLSPTDQLILEHTLGLHNKPILSNQGLAKKLRLSPGAVSQRKAKIQSYLDMFDQTGLM